MKARTSRIFYYSTTVVAGALSLVVALETVLGREWELAVAAVAGLGLTAASFRLARTPRRAFAAGVVREKPKPSRRAVLLSLSAIPAIWILVAGLSWLTSVQKSDSIEKCSGPTAPDLRIEVCSRLLRYSRESRSDRAKIFNNRGYAYTSKGKLDFALRDYDEAIQLDPGYAMALTGRCGVYVNKGEYDRAIEDCREAAERKPDYALAQAGLALAYQGKHQYDTALQDYRKAIELAPENAVIVALRGTAYQDAHQGGDAFQDYDHAVALAPTNGMVFALRCQGYTRLGEIGKAIADCDRALELGADNGLTLDHRAFAYLKAGRYADARTDFDAALKTEGDLAEALYGRGLVKLHDGDPSGEADIAQAIALKRDVADDVAIYELAP